MTVTAASYEKSRCTSCRVDTQASLLKVCCKQSGCSSEMAAPAKRSRPAALEATVTATVPGLGQPNVVFVLADGTAFSAVKSA